MCKSGQWNYLLASIRLRVVTVITAIVVSLYHVTGGLVTGHVSGSTAAVVVTCPSRIWNKTCKYFHTVLYYVHYTLHCTLHCALYYVLVFRD